MKLCQLLLLAIAVSFAAQQKGFSQMPVATPCGIPAYPSAGVPTALSWINPVNGQPQILFNPAFFNELGMNGAILFRFAMAHECRHHLNGDVVGANLDPQGYLMITPEIELRADCGAAQFLKSVGDIQALQFAIQYWAAAGNAPTGLNYPTGTQRAQALMQCGQ
jgi:hypothetical protein